MLLVCRGSRIVDDLVHALGVSKIIFGREVQRGVRWLDFLAPG